MNLRKEDFFVGWYHSNIYTLKNISKKYIYILSKIYTRGYVQCVITCIIEWFLKGDANSHLAKSLWDEQKAYNIRIERLINILPTREINSFLRGWTLLCLRFNYGFALSEFILQQCIPSIKLMECHPADISLAWSNTTYLLSLNSQRVKPVCCFRRGASSLMFDRIQNVTPCEEKFSTSGGYTRESWTPPAS